MRIAEELGVEAEIVLYQKTPPCEETLRWIVEHLDGNVTDLVRRDALFAKLGLTDAEVATSDQVVSVLVTYPKLLQRPVVVRGAVAIIGRPKERITVLLSH